MQQMNLFEATYEKPSFPSHIKLIELFAGIGAQFKSLKALGVDVESHRTCEWSWQSIIAYNAIHHNGEIADTSHMTYQEVLDFIEGVSHDYNKPMTRKNLERRGEEWCRKVAGAMITNHNLCPDVSKLHGKDLDIRDKDENLYILTYSFPCLVADSLVLTDEGYKKIIDVKAGDKVLTHKNHYKRVLNWWRTGSHDTLKINAAAFDELIVTKNHKILTKDGWKEARFITKKDMLGIAVNQKSEVPEWKGIDFEWKDGRKSRHSSKLDVNNPNFWWIVGRYLGDGWLRKQGGIIICCAKNELAEIAERIGDMFNYSVVEERTVYKIHIALKELGSFLERFGKGASNKKVIGEVIDLPIPLLKEFLEGYFSSDGCEYKNYKQCGSVSRELIYGIGQCVAKAYKKPFSIYKVKVSPKTIIEGREVNQKEWYMLRYKTSGATKGYYDEENRIIWFPINRIEENGVQEVYDIEVDEDHSFVANSAIVHNCQDLSNAGLQKGYDKGTGTRSGLLWEVERILLELKEADCLPQVLLMENVPAVCNQSNLKPWNQWLEALQRMGYTNYFQILNSKDFQIPQNRERCFMISLLGEHSFSFPFKMPQTHNLESFIVKTGVGGWYYLPDSVVANFTQKDEGDP